MIWEDEADIRWPMFRAMSCPSGNASGPRDAEPYNRCQLERWTPQPAGPFAHRCRSHGKAGLALDHAMAGPSIGGASGADVFGPRLLLLQMVISSGRASLLPRRPCSTVSLARRHPPVTPLQVGPSAQGWSIKSWGKRLQLLAGDHVAADPVTGVATGRGALPTFIHRPVHAGSNIRCRQSYLRQRCRTT